MRDEKNNPTAATQVPKQFRKLKTWLVVACPACLVTDRLPTHFRRKTAAARFAARPDLFFCGECEGPVDPLSVQPIGETMKARINS